jgi:hypothetical protein
MRSSSDCLTVLQRLSDWLSGPEFDSGYDFSALYRRRRACVFFMELRMPRLRSIVPKGDIYLVLDDFGPLGRAWRETDEAAADRATLVRNLLDGQYEDPVCIVAFNTAEGWSRDVTVDIADEVRRRFIEYDEVPPSVLRFIEAANRH